MSALSNLSIRARILVIMWAVAILSAGITAYLVYSAAQRALAHQALEELTAVRELKADQVEDYFQGIADQVVSMSANRMTIDAMVGFQSAFEAIETDLDLGTEEIERRDLELRLFYQNEFLPRLNANLEQDANLTDVWPRARGARSLQFLYIADNPFDTGSKHLLDNAEDGSTYSDVHDRYHPIFRDYLERFGYYDVFLVDHTTGHIVYSVFKEVDYGTSLVSGPYRATNFARAFEAASEASNPGFVRLADFEPYPPSYNAPASFIASPIFDGDAKIGVLVFQMPVDRINDVMTSSQNWAAVGLGATGETYLVADDGTWRNQSRFLIEDREAFLSAIAEAGVPAHAVDAIARLDSTIGLLDAQTEGTIAALEGNMGTGVFADYRGVSVMSAYRPLAVQDVQWVILSEMDEAEALAATRALRNRLLLVMLALVVVTAVVAAALARSLTLPLARLSQRANELAGGNLDVVFDTRGLNEIAELSRSIEAMRVSLKAQVLRQAAAIEALSTPLIPLHDEIMIMPLVGELDGRRVETIRAALVDGLHDAGAKVAILDVTGVPTMENSVAIGLVRAVAAVRLLGATVIITGVQPELANQLSDLDLPMDGIRTELSLHRGIDMALGLIGPT